MFSHHSTKDTDLLWLSGFVMSVVYVHEVGVDLFIWLYNENCI